jgi:hypothetical protein
MHGTFRLMISLPYLYYSHKFYFMPDDKKKTGGGAKVHLNRSNLPEAKHQMKNCCSKHSKPVR